MSRTNRFLSVVGGDTCWTGPTALLRDGVTRDPARAGSNAAALSSTLSLFTPTDATHRLVLGNLLENDILRAHFGLNGQKKQQVPETKG